MTSSAPLTSVPEIINALLDLTSWAVFDVDPDGRILAGNDRSGSMQLVEITPDGTRTQLTRLPSRCSGRYVPGARRVVVQHDTGGDERTQLSILDLAPASGSAGSLAAPPVRLPATLADLTPLVHDPAHKHDLADVCADSVVFLTNRRDGVDFDVVMHDLATGTETTLYDGGGYLVDAVASHDRSSVAITVLSGRPHSTQILTAGPHTLAVTAPDEHAHHSQVAWTAGDDALIMASDHEREFAAVIQVSTSSGPDDTTWATLVEADDHDLEVVLSPDATAMVVGHHQDGATTLAVHEPDGTHRCDVALHDAGVPRRCHRPHHHLGRRSHPDPRGPAHLGTHRAPCAHPGRRADPLLRPPASTRQHLSNHGRHPRRGIRARCARRTRG